MLIDDFANHVRLAAGRAEVRDAVADVYRRLQQQIDQRRPICVASGKCCHFDEYGHRLYVTTMEMAAFVYHLAEVEVSLIAGGGSPGLLASGQKRPGLPPPAINDAHLIGEGHSVRLNVVDESNQPARGDPSGCPFQIGKLCGVHSIRPFGCRIFFCDSTATQWQQDQYEAFHAELKMLHAKLNVPYFYVEWRNALREFVKSNMGGAE